MDQVSDPTKYEEGRMVVSVFAEFEVENCLERASGLICFDPRLYVMLKLNLEKKNGQQVCLELCLSSLNV